MGNEILTLKYYTWRFKEMQNFKHLKKNYLANYFNEPEIVSSSLIFLGGPFLLAVFLNGRVPQGTSLHCASL